jgi:hypothetical protein
MSESREIKGQVSACEVKPRAKKPYCKPPVRYERVFEVQALTCGKVNATQWSCNHNRKGS